MSEWLGSREVIACWTQIAAATVSGNSLRQTVHTLCASVHQADKMVAALFRVALFKSTADLGETFRTIQGPRLGHFGPYNGTVRTTGLDSSVGLLRYD